MTPILTASYKATNASSNITGLDPLGRCHNSNDIHLSAKEHVDTGTAPLVSTCITAPMHVARELAKAWGPTHSSVQHDILGRTHALDPHHITAACKVTHMTYEMACRASGSNCVRKPKDRP
jgi:hypothetical protein